MLDDVSSCIVGGRRLLDEESSRSWSGGGASEDGASSISIASGRVATLATPGLTGPLWLAVVVIDGSEAKYAAATSFGRVW